MRRDYRRFLKGGENKKKAAACKNVINYPLFKVPLCHVCPPYLQIVLGIVKKHHDMLENECHKLDKDIATYFAQTNQPVDKNTHFGKHVTKLRKEKRNKSKPAGELKNGTGPVASNLDAVLNKHRIVQKAYHGRSFVGNHCKKYLQPQVSGDITSSVPKTALQLASHQEILTKAEIIHQKFGQLFELFSTVDGLLSHDLPVTETTITKTDKAISDYIKFYRRNFPGENTLPKQHILEHHCSAWVQTWGFGMSLMGEQGGEQLHATINALKRRAWGIKKERDQLKFLRKQHHTEISPALRKHLSTTPTKKS